MPGPPRRPCNFGINCTRAGCHFSHPPGWAYGAGPAGAGPSMGGAPRPPGRPMRPCNFGVTCTRPDCHFSHPPGWPFAATPSPPSAMSTSSPGSAPEPTAYAPGADQTVTRIAFAPATRLFFTCDHVSGAQGEYALPARVWTSYANGTVSGWDPETWQGVESGGVAAHRVRALTVLIANSFLFVGCYSAEGLGTIHVRNLMTNAEHRLDGHMGSVTCLAFVTEPAGNAPALVSGGHDATVRVWRYDAAQGRFGPSPATLGAQHGGHLRPVLSLVAVGQYVSSACESGKIVVWDMAVGNCVQSIEHAHSRAITQLLEYNNHLLSASMDGEIKVWPGAGHAPGQAWAQHPVAGPQQQQGITAMAVTTDAQNADVLMVAYEGEGCVKLFNLPTFVPRGVTPVIPTSITAVASAAAGSGRHMLVGSADGNMHVFQWQHGGTFSYLGTRHA